MERTLKMEVNLERQGSSCAEKRTQFEFVCGLFVLQRRGHIYNETFRTKNLRFV